MSGDGASLAGGDPVLFGAGGIARKTAQAAHVMNLSGASTIGAFSLVDMGAVVTHDVPPYEMPYEIWAGVPARRLRAADIPERASTEGTR